LKVILTLTLVLCSGRQIGLAAEKEIPLEKLNELGMTITASKHALVFQQ
jgi:hypothetical protein